MIAFKPLYLENDKFEVIEFDKDRYEKSKRTHIYYKIRCKQCGSIFSRKKEALKNFENLKCRNCIHNRFGKSLNVVLYDVYVYYVRNAISRKIKWNFTEEEFKEFIIQPCAYCGCLYERNGEKISGIDRIDSTKDYTKDNCVPCCKFCNIMKNKFSKEQFLEKVSQIYNNLIKSSTTISKESTSQANGDGNGGLLTAA